MCMCACVRACLRMDVCVCARARARAYVRARVHVCVHMYVRVHVCVLTRGFSALSLLFSRCLKGDSFKTSPIGELVPVVKWFPHSTGQ